MKKVSAVALWILLFGFLPGIKAQEAFDLPKIELCGSYDFVHYNANPRINGVPPSESFSANGIGGQAEYNVNRWIGLVGDFGAYSLARTGFNTTHQISYLFGPRINLRHGVITPFVQTLFGGVWAEDGITFGSITAFGMTAGGGIDIRVSRYLAVRPAQAEYFMTRFPDGANDRQNNFRYSVGVVLLLNKK